MEIRSSAFDQDGKIPTRFTEDGDNLSPEISWSGLPDGTAELALVVDDPDAPTEKPWVHWLVYGIDAKRDGIPEGSPGGGVEGLATGGEVAYTGPAPPAGGGPHHYRFTLYALDESPGLKPGATRDALMERIDGHILGQTQLVGTYERPPRGH